MTYKQGGVLSLCCLTTPGLRKDIRRHTNEEQCSLATSLRNILYIVFEC